MVRKLHSATLNPIVRPLDNCQVGETTFQINDFARWLLDTAALKERAYFLFMQSISDS